MSKSDSMSKSAALLAKSHYGIRPDYVARDEALTFVDDPADYWTPKRRRMAEYYQHYVYTHAASLMASRGYTSCLDVGCGFPAKARKWLLPIATRVTLVDQPSMTRMVAEACPEIPFVPLDLENPQHEFDEKFQCVVCADVIEHLLDPDALLSFLLQAVADDGVVILSTPDRDVQRGRACLQSPKVEHVREWNVTEFRNYLDSSGFEVVEHQNIPIGRLTGLEEALLPALRRTRLPRYIGCQMVVCRPKERK